MVLQTAGELLQLGMQNPLSSSQVPELGHGLLAEHVSNTQIPEVQEDEKGVPAARFRSVHSVSEVHVGMFNCAVASDSNAETVIIATMISLFCK